MGLLQRWIGVFSFFSGFFYVNILGDFTFLVIPDTQHYSQDRATAPLEAWKAQTNWAVDMIDSLNLVFVSHLGDITERQDVTLEWDNAKEAMEVLHDKVPYSVNRGNHDDIGTMNSYFPVDDYTHFSWWGGHFRGIQNTYQLLTFEGMDFIIVNIQDHSRYSSDDGPSKSWANDILEQYSNRRAIIVTHDISNDIIVEDVTQNHDNVFLTVAGHSCRREDHWITKSPSGYDQHNIITDYQCDSPETGILRYYTFKPAEDKIYAYTYSPYTDVYERDSDSEFSWDYDMEVPVSIVKTFMSTQKEKVIHLKSGDLIQQVKLYSMRGESLSGIEHNKNEIYFNDFPKGIYHLQVSLANGSVLQEKIFFQ